MKNFIYIPSLVLLILFASCSGFGLPVEQEEDLGKMMSEEILNSAGPDYVIEDPLTDSIVDVVTSRLLGSLNQVTYRYRFTVVNDKQINAYTLPGGRIFINKGLLTFCSSPEMLAGVLAHEIGHAEEKHVTNKIIKELGLSLIFSILSHGNDLIITQIAHQITSTAFDREQETNADKFALELLENANIQPSVLGDFFKEMNSKSGSGEIPEILSTHPANDNRISLAEEFKPRSSFKNKPFTMNWAEYKSHLKALN